MEKYTEVIHKILELTETMQEGLDYIDRQLSDLKYEQACAVLADIVEAEERIQDSLKMMANELQDNCIEDCTNELRSILGKTMQYYENGEAAKMQDTVETCLIPVYRKWRDEIRRALEPYVLS